MSILEIILLAIGLAMDAFAVAICKGLALRRATLRSMLTVGLYFGVFQALMPIAGYFLGVSFREYIVSIDHWIAFFLLLAIGAGMIKESFDKSEDDAAASLAFSAMVVLAVATSIDALAVGVTFAFLATDIWLPAALIGVITCGISMAGVKIGAVFGAKFKSAAERVGGVILILIGVKILVEHLL